MLIFLGNKNSHVILRAFEFLKFGLFLTWKYGDLFQTLKNNLK